MTTIGQKVGDATADVIGLLGGTGGTYSSHSYKAVADPALYQAACVKYLTAVQNLMLDGIKAKAAK